jgi:HTH-type transcriptional regulator/antitoxin HipB
MTINTNSCCSGIVKLVSGKRKSLKLSKSKASENFKLGRNFIADVENGKETAQVGKVLDYMDGLGLEVVVVDRNDKFSAIGNLLSILEKEDKRTMYKFISSLTDEEKILTGNPLAIERTERNIKRMSFDLGLG